MRGGLSLSIGSQLTAQTVALVTPAEHVKSDSRWDLIQRILLTGPFQKSVNLYALLNYLAEHAIIDHAESLTERQIGIAVFGKPAGYSPAEDSAVRVHVRQLRLRLHEYFACDGKSESLIVDIPKGSYVLEFHDLRTEPGPIFAPFSAQPRPSAAPQPRRMRNTAVWVACAALSACALVCAFGWYHAARTETNSALAWPLNAILQPGSQTTIVISDGNTSTLRFLDQKEITLDEYLQPGFRRSLIPQNTDVHVSTVLNYIADSQLTSFADLAVTSTLLKLAGTHANQLVLCSARDLDRRDLEHGNYVFVGSPMSNPWVSLFSDRLNFEVVEDGVGGKMYFRNRKPLPGEQATYEGLPRTGSAGEDYATLALLPSSIGPGNVLIFQGLRQEGTEALAVLLADAKDRAQLEHALGINDRSKSSPYFEVLVRVQAVAGAPVSTRVVALRNFSR
jgi:hypothetical protein